MAMLCAEAAYLRSIEFRRLKWADVTLPGNLRLSHEPHGSAAFVVHRRKSDKARAQIRVFNDAYAIAMMQMIRDERIRQLSNTSGDKFTSETVVLERLICPDLTYGAYNDAIRTVSNYFDLSDARFTTYDARIGVTKSEFAKIKDVGALKLAGDGKARAPRINTSGLDALPSRHWKSFQTCNRGL